MSLWSVIYTKQLTKRGEIDVLKKCFNIFSSERVTIFLQGSYANNTCVRGDSDVDIAKSIVIL